MTGAELLVNQSLNIKKGEKALIVTDNATRKVADELSKVIKKSGATSVIYTIDENQRPLKKIPPELVAMIPGINAGLTPFVSSADEGSFRFALVKSMTREGARVAHMPGITWDILMDRNLENIDYSEIEKTAKKIASALNSKNTIRITTKKGTDLTLDIKGRKIIPEELEIKKGEMQNFPSGEVFIAPLETSANGTFVCDVCLGSLGAPDSPITLTFKDGLITKIDGKNTAKKLKTDLGNATGEKNRICEFAIGSNPFFKPIGNTLVDEKVLGTCHVAVGDNLEFGGRNKSSIHVDFVADSPTIEADGKIIMKEGKIYGKRSD